MNDRENVELEQLPIHVDVDFVPLSALRPPSIIHQDVERSKVTNDSIETFLMERELQHVQRNDENIFGAQRALGQWQALLLRRF